MHGSMTQGRDRTRTGVEMIIIFTIIIHICYWRTKGARYGEQRDNQ